MAEAGHREGDREPGWEDGRAPSEAPTNEDKEDTYHGLESP